MKRRMWSSASLVFAALLAGVVGLIGGQQEGQAAFPGSNGLIAFTSNRDTAGGEIYTFTPDGTTTRLTFSNASYDPAWSPEGTRIAFISTGNQLFVMNANGTARKQITTTPTAKNSPVWSPDGTRIAYVANSFDVDGQTDFEIWSINADGSGRKQLTNNTYLDEQPAWSPLGDKIAFVGSRPGDTDRNIYVMNADGSNQTNITPGTSSGCTAGCYKGHDDSPAWSPDGTKIAYVHAHNPLGGDAPDIWVMAPNGAGRTSLSNNDTMSELAPAWSPDGSRIVYNGISGGSSIDIYLMDADGTNQEPIETTVAKDEKLDWQPIPVCTQTVNANNDPLNGTAGNDVLCGDARANIINGGGGNDIILAQGGNDRLAGGFGNDVLHGGGGSDIIAYGGATAVRASLTTGFASGVGRDVLIAAENLTGSSANDRLTGSSAANVLIGGGGADRLIGLGGDDTLRAQDGVADNDTLYGGGGTDTCITDATEAFISGCP